MDLVKGDIGPEAKYDVKFEDGKLKLGVSYEGALAGSSVEVHVGAKQVLEALKKVIPGVVDDVVLDAASKALGL